MKLEEMKKYYSRKYGILIYEKYDAKDRRKRYYKINYPVFEDGKELPVSSENWLVKTPEEVKKFIDKTLLINAKYKSQCERWVDNH